MMQQNDSTRKLRSTKRQQDDQSTPKQSKFRKIHTPKSAPAASNRRRSLRRSTLKANVDELELKLSSKKKVSRNLAGKVESITNVSNKKSTDDGKKPESSPTLENSTAKKFSNKDKKGGPSTSCANVSIKNATEKSIEERSNSITKNSSNQDESVMSDADKTVKFPNKDELMEITTRADNHDNKDPITKVESASILVNKNIKEASNTSKEVKSPGSLVKSSVKTGAAKNNEDVKNLKNNIKDLKTEPVVDTDSEKCMIDGQANVSQKDLNKDEYLLTPKEVVEELLKVSEGKRKERQALIDSYKGELHSWKELDKKLYQQSKSLRKESKEECVKIENTLVEDKCLGQAECIKQKSQLVEQVSRVQDQAERMVHQQMNLNADIRKQMEQDTELLIETTPELNESIFKLAWDIMQA